MLNLKTYLGVESFDSLPDTLTNDISADGVGADFGIPENLIVDADGGEQTNETTGVIQEGAGVAEGDQFAAGIPAEGENDFPYVDPRPDSDDAVAEEQAYLEDEQRTEELEEAQTALENYIGLIKQAGSKGISKQSAAFMAVGMKRVDRILGNGTKSLGLESFDATPRSAAGVTTVSLEDLKDKLKEAGKAAVEKAKELWKKLVEFLKGMVSRSKNVEAKSLYLQTVAKKAPKTPEEAKTVPAPPPEAADTKTAQAVEAIKAGKKPAAKEFNWAELCNKCAVDGKVDPGYKSELEMLTWISTKWLEVMANGVKKAITIIESFDGDVDGNFQDVLGIINDGLKDVSFTIGGGGVVSVEPDTARLAYTPGEGGGYSANERPFEWASNEYMALTTGSKAIGDQIDKVYNAVNDYYKNIHALERAFEPKWLPLKGEESDKLGEFHYKVELLLGCPNMHKAIKAAEASNWGRFELADAIADEYFGQGAFSGAAA